MPKTALKNALDIVRGALKEPRRIAPEDLQELSDLNDAIERALEETEELHGETGEQVSRSATSLIERLEISHPQLTAALGRLAETLAAIGI